LPQMSETMKAMQFRSYGPADVLCEAEVAKPKPRPHEVLIEVHASSVNPIDWKLRRGDFRMLMPLKLPATPGFDLSGTIVETGSAVQDYKVGDEVYSRSNKNPGQAAAEFIALDPSYIALKPKNLDHNEAAAIPLAALTALQALRDKGGLKEGQSLLVNGASGGVGHFAVQIAKALGAHVVGVCGPDKQELVKELGADQVIDYRSQNPLETDTSYDVIFDAVANLRYQDAAKKLKKTGAYISTVPKLTRILKYTVGNLVLSKKETFIMMKPSGQDLSLLTEWAEGGKLRPVIDSVFPLIDLALAHKKSESGRARGKIVVSIK